MTAGRDDRSVGELLLDSEFIARDILFDGPELQGPAMLRTWGEVVQAAGDLWDALPVPVAASRGAEGEAYVMARLQEMTLALHRSTRGRSWPGEGPADPRLSQIADNLTRAAQLITAAEPTPPREPATWADLDAAKTRLMHTLYIASHGVALAVGWHARDLEAHFHHKGWISPSQSLTAVRAAQNRLAAFEQLTGSYVAATYPHALHGEHRVAPESGRLAHALAGWDIQAHRSLTAHPTAANLMLLAQTQAMLTGAAGALLFAGAHAGHLPAALYPARMSPTLEAAHAAWTSTARTWTTLTPPSHRRPDPELSLAAAETRAALREITHDQTGPASPGVIASRTDLPKAITAVQQLLSSGVELAHLMRDSMQSSAALLGAARAINTITMATDPLAAGSDKPPGRDAAFVNPRDIAANRPIPIPDLVLTGCRTDLDTTIDAARDAMNAAAGLAYAPHRVTPQMSRTTPGRHQQDRTPPPGLGANRPGPGCEK